MNLKWKRQSNAVTKYFFELWKTNAAKAKSIREYDEWCEYREEAIAEENFARESGMDSINFCWSCRYSECQIHN